MIEMTREEWDRLEVKFAIIGERISMQMKNAIIDYVSGQIDLEDSKKKPKPYYRKGRWE
jgi:hypothetical protein